ncbi:MAG: recombinase family protein [Butyrivibrio sp.]|uniref:recombinase family protein n=1 Tax=Butyrivibrio sp. TaxID=28121 RepID=UPI001B2AA57F|nr:recombinase family protein [Butyrivibrio sp.]MBO5623202.1 recombinase family protein [Butyrivibrio sp.]MBP3781728.1 recombinase family protein [Butyrivibrio sp.]
MENQKQQHTALYERTNHVSNSPDEPNGILAQKKTLMEYAKSHKLTCLKHYSDEGISGGKLDRPALNELLRDVRSGYVGAVVVKDISRIGRNLVEVIRIVQALQDNGAHLISVSDGIDIFSQKQGGGRL